MLTTRLAASDGKCTPRVSKKFYVRVLCEPWFTQAPNMTLIPQWCLAYGVRIWLVCIIRANEADTLCLHFRRPSLDWHSEGVWSWFGQCQRYLSIHSIFPFFVVYIVVINLEAQPSHVHRDVVPHTNNTLSNTTGKGTVCTEYLPMWALIGHRCPEHTMERVGINTGKYLLLNNYSIFF